jgi:hypothetical protein
MLYMEAPAGVGFSYADDANYTTTDDEVEHFIEIMTLYSFYLVFRQPCITIWL